MPDRYFWITDNTVPFEIKTPETEEEFERYFHLRWKILRAPWNQPQGSEIDDIEQQCFHVMAVDTNSENHNDVIGVARLQFNSDTESQIRYMAVSDRFERKGIGRSMVYAMEYHAKQSGSKTLVLDAREPAVGFYEKLGYSVTAKSYLLFDQIQHFRMINNLDHDTNTKEALN